MTIDELIEQLENASGPSYSLDEELLSLALGQHARWPWKYPTGSLSDATYLVEKALPGWSWKVGKCHLSDDAWLAPDFSDPEFGPALLERFGPAGPDFDPDVGFDVDRRPAGNPALAMCEAFARAMKAVREKS